MHRKSKKILFYYEKFKAGLLVFLMILCIVQVGILWSSQSGSFPIYFLSAFFSGSKAASQTSIEDSKGEFMLPSRLVISTGFDEDHYIIPNGSQDYNTLWNGAKLYLVQALDNKPRKIETFTEDAWGTLVANKPYTFEFKTQIPIEIIKWLLNLKSSAGEGLNGIYKIVICPDDPDNNYSDTIYIRDQKNIYTYDLSDFKGNALSKAEFDRIYNNQKENPHAKDYQLAIEKFRVKNFEEAPIKISQDLLGPYIQTSTETYPNITCVPFAGLEDDVYHMSDYEQISKELFGESRNDYDYDEDINGSAVFKKADSVYRLYKNSVLEYKFTGKQGTTEKPDILEAYKKAVKFILDHNRENGFMSNLSIYLKSIEQNQSSIVFNFDYGLSLGNEKGEIPIIMKNYEIPGSSKQIDSSISIEVSSKRVVHCEWLALKFKVDKEVKGYEWNFVDMHTKVFEQYKELEKEELSATDFGIYYILSYPKAHQNLITPSFVLYTKDGRYDIPMKGITNN